MTRKKKQFIFLFLIQKHLIGNANQYQVTLQLIDGCLHMKYSLIFYIEWIIELFRSDSDYWLRFKIRNKTIRINFLKVIDIERTKACSSIIKNFSYPQIVISTNTTIGICKEALNVLKRILLLNWIAYDMPYFESFTLFCVPSKPTTSNIGIVPIELFVLKQLKKGLFMTA